MRLYNNSLAAKLIQTLLNYGNLPYRSLKIMLYNYESLKASAQKLIRAKSS